MQLLISRHSLLLIILTFICIFCYFLLLHRFQYQQIWLFWIEVWFFFRHRFFTRIAVAFTSIIILRNVCIFLRFMHFIYWWSTKNNSSSYIYYIVGIIILLIELGRSFGFETSMLENNNTKNQGLLIYSKGKTCGKTYTE